MLRRDEARQNYNLARRGNFGDTCGKMRFFLLFFRKIAKKSEFYLDFCIGGVYTAVTAAQYAVPEKGKAPVAQLDRASDYGSEGLRFESSRACFSQGMNKMPVRFNETGFFVLTYLEEKKTWGRPGFD